MKMTAAKRVMVIGIALLSLGAGLLGYHLSNNPQPIAQPKEQPTIYTSANGAVVYEYDTHRLTYWPTFPPLWIYEEK